MALDQSTIVELAQWLQSPAGRYVRRWEQAQVDAMVANVFGYHAIQIGLPEWDLLSANRMPFKARTHQESSPGNRAAGVSLVLEPENLPFDSDSVDLLVMPHVLECSSSPHQILREAERVLVPEGRLVMTGFNPWSLWGLRESIPGLDPLLPSPVHQQVSVARLKDWCKLLQLEIDRGRFGCYAPLCQTQKWLERWAFMEHAGDRWWPVCGAAYAVSAVKRVAGMRLVAPAWKRKRKRRERRQAAVASRQAHESGDAAGRQGAAIAATSTERAMEIIQHESGSRV
ncbi:class I SAM-dependent methyltransferase [Paracandidimonas soli]|uniref:Methyltransferase family protein n=1 Tax=Paracandidimonas soli TaxID=1917182 RepID=A0A4R3VBB0_9BURK|nr:methyltransferase domain-containing protein [Paracandidimonas soli]TCV01341.1 methyltransferase family protein [Paracandidimonas soli]